MPDAVKCARVYAFFFAAALFAAFAGAQELTVYDDALQNGFLNYSYGGVPADFNFASEAQAHDGTKSIAFIGDDFNALSFARPGQAVTTATYPTLHFWVHGGASGGQQLRLYLELNGAVVANAELDSYVTGGAIVAGAWREVSVTLGSAPLSYAGSFDRIDLQSDVEGAQPVLYVDGMSLTNPPPAAADAMLIEQDVVVAGMASDRFTWRDSANKTRVAVLAHNDVGAGPGGARGGALREFRYQLPDGTTRILNVTTYGNAGYAGFGYVVAHATNSNCIGDDSPLGGFIAGHWERVFEGRHHAIFRFTQNYTRNCATTQPVVQRTVPIVIEWVFSTGHDHPLWAVTWNLDQATPAAPANTFYDDSRAPYGELNIDGDGSIDIDGVGWGDRYKFNSTTAPVTLNSNWTWNVANSIPYVKLWLAGPLSGTHTKDATMGIVQTQTMTQQDAAGGRDPFYHDMTANWGKTSADGNAGGAYKMPYQSEWPYQANAFNLGTATSSNNARLTWRTQWGFLGQTSYTVNDGVVANAPGYPKKSYSTYIVMGTHTSAPVESQVTQVETMQSLTLTATVGSVVTSGPAGVTRADSITYDPPGYNHVYGALAFSADANALDANIAVGAGTLQKPLLIVSNYTSPLAPDTVMLDGAALAADADYYASVRTSANELWITLNRNLTGAANHLEVSVATTAPDAPTIGAATPGNNSASIAFTAPANDGGSPILSYTASCTPGVHTASGGASPITVSGLTNNTTYSCSVTATNAAGTSAPSGTVNVTPIAPFGAPANLLATAASAAQVAVSWSPVAGAVNYELHRKFNGSAFALLTTTAATSYNDGAVSANTSYVYEVRALNGGGPSAFSAADAATTIVFTNDPLSVGTAVKTTHITQLRTAVNAMRATAGLTAQSFTDPALSVSIRVKAVHVTELRTALNQARSALALAAINYTDPTITAASTRVKAVHVVDLRNGVK